MCSISTTYGVRFGISEVNFFAAFSVVSNVSRFWFWPGGSERRLDSVEFAVNCLVTHKKFLELSHTRHWWGARAVFALSSVCLVSVSSVYEDFSD